MKVILKILGIVTFFSLVGYLLTYPYELSYKGDDEIILIEESYEYTSLEQIINRPEFKDKTLYIRIGEPLESEYDGSENNIQPKRKSFESQLKVLSEIRSRYKEKEMKIILLSYSDTDSKQKKDNLRKWKAIIKKYKRASFYNVSKFS